jgi:hypothetical protein
MATKKTAAKEAAVPVPANDNITKLIGKVLPQYHDTDDYIDIVQWNLRWFNSKEPKRVDAIYKVLAQVNSDIFVFQEVADGSVDGLAERLTKAGLGTYEAYYGSNGGQQRVAFMYDTEWLRRAGVRRMQACGECSSEPHPCCKCEYSHCAFPSLSHC